MNTKSKPKYRIIYKREFGMANYYYYVQRKGLLFWKTISDSICTLNAAKDVVELFKDMDKFNETLG